jgi:2-dehydropantoate 2-reductase
MSSQVNVLVIGAGAIGGFYGAILNRAGARVSVVARSDLDVLKEQGYRIRSQLGDLSYLPAGVYASAAEVSDKPDFLVVALKVIEGVDRVDIIRPAVGPNTTIVLIENGIGIEQEIADAFPGHPLVSCLAFIAVSRVAPGELDHKAYGTLTFGDYPKGVGPQAKRFAELLEQGGVPAELSESVVGERWRKCVWNTSFNPSSVVAGGADTQTLLTTPGGRELIESLMQEVCATAEAEGYPLPEGIIEGNIKSTLKMPPYWNSMALDWLNGRSMEIEPILGNVVRAAQARGVAVPRLETVYALIKLLVANQAKKA